MNANEVVAFLQKPKEQFTKEDILFFIEKNNIRMVNFLYPGGDGRLKTLNFVVNDYDYLDTILTYGERVDGSSLFSFIEAGSSDLYVVPRLRTAFVNPFSEEPTLNLLCSYFNAEGKPLESAPEHTLHKAAKAFTEETGFTFQAMGELEYYVIRPDSSDFRAEDQRGYHESAPFAQTNHFRTRCMAAIAKAGGQIKYGHSEVGNFKLGDLVYEQNEIEFLPVDVEDAADQLTIAKWIIRNLAHEAGFQVTFAPKITTGKAGSGLHIHMRIMKDGENKMVENNRLSDDARRLIAGLMEMAPALTAFGNKNPTSYFRLVPHQEAPTNICWGDRNRSVLVRVPLGWVGEGDMLHEANPLEPKQQRSGSFKQTVEIRSADGSANVYQLLAGICVAARYGFQRADALDIAQRTYVDVNIHDAKNENVLSHLSQLPTCCVESAERLLEARTVFEEKGVFSPAMIEGIARELTAFDDRNLRRNTETAPEAVKQLVERFFHCG